VNELPTVCILAGGRGRRLGPRVTDVPKPLLEVGGEPFLFHQLRLLARHGARRVVLCVGYLGERVRDRIGSRRFGLRIEYSFDAPGLDGTLGAIRRAQHLLGDRFLVLYGDTYLRLDYRAAADEWRRSGCLGLMVVLRNDGQWDQSNTVYADGRVIEHHKWSPPTSPMKWIDYGLGGLKAKALDRVPASEADLSSLYKRLAELGELCGYEARERFYEIGRPESLAETDAFLRRVNASDPVSR
jgi:N-acetyl-alpha-D-muramate 1-phosphate uridylyltransferase